jgi:hypothetical protein
LTEATRINIDDHQLIDFFLVKDANRVERVTNILWLTKAHSLVQTTFVD